MKIVVKDERCHSIYSCSPTIWHDEISNSVCKAVLGNPTFTCSKLTLETPAQISHTSDVSSVKYEQKMLVVSRPCGQIPL